MTSLSGEHENRHIEIEIRKSYKQESLKSQDSEDVLFFGRWILLEKCDQYVYYKVEETDEFELKYLLYAMMNTTYFGIDNFKRVIDLIEHTKQYEHLSLIICAGLISCTTAYYYVLSYLKYLNNHHEYYNVDLIRMLLRFITSYRFINTSEVEEEIIKAFPSKDMIPIIEGVYYYSNSNYQEYWT